MPAKRSKAGRKKTSTRKKSSSSRYFHIDFRPPKSVRAEARRAERLIDQGKAGSGMKAETKAWVRKVAQGKSVTPAKAKKIAPWHARHASDRRPGWARPGKETPGYVANKAWFGRAGASWGRKLARQMKAADQAAGRKKKR